MKVHAIIAAALLSATSTMVYAQTPSGNNPPSAAQPTSPSTQGSTSGPPYMMGGGMMAQGGMMGQGAMMPQGGMMGGGLGMGGMGGMGGMSTIDRIEGRIAFLKAELRITDAQSEAWNAFADALRGNAKKLGELRSSMDPQASLVDRLAWQEKWLTARAEDTRAIRTAYTDLAARLSDEQKKSAEQLLAPHMGMMAMMSGIGSGQMMGGMGMGQMMGGSGMGMGQTMPMMQGGPMTTGRVPPK
jgi:LTXXQ motif family protein